MGALYEERLQRLHGQLAELIEHHRPHDLGPMGEKPRCRSCGQVLPDEEVETCPTDMRCDVLFGAIDDAIIAAFPAAEAERFLDDLGHELLEWGPSSGMSAETPRQLIHYCLTHDAWLRLFPIFPGDEHPNLYGRVLTDPSMTVSS